MWQMMVCTRLLLQAHQRDTAHMTIIDFTSPILGHVAMHGGRIEMRRLLCSVKLNCILQNFLQSKHWSFVDLKRRFGLAHAAIRVILGLLGFPWLLTMPLWTLHSLPLCEDVREKHQLIASCMCPNQDQTRNLGMYSAWKSNPPPFSIWDVPPTNWASQGNKIFFN